MKYRVITASSVGDLRERVMLADQVRSMFPAHTPIRDGAVRNKRLASATEVHNWLAGLHHVGDSISVQFYLGSEGCDHHITAIPEYIEGTAPSIDSHAEAQLLEDRVILAALKRGMAILVRCGGAMLCGIRNDGVITILSQACSDHTSIWNMALDKLNNMEVPKTGFFLGEFARAVETNLPVKEVDAEDPPLDMSNPAYGVYIASIHALLTMVALLRQNNEHIAHTGMRPLLPIDKNGPINDIPKDIRKALRDFWTNDHGRWLGTIAGRVSSNSSLTYH